MLKKICLNKLEIPCRHSLTDFGIDGGCIVAHELESVHNSTCVVPTISENLLQTVFIMGGVPAPHPGSTNKIFRLVQQLDIVIPGCNLKPSNSPHD
jgi:hypothetical protein